MCLPQLLQPEKLRQMSPIELEAALRSILLKLQYTKAILKPLPTGELRLASTLKGWGKVATQHTVKQMTLLCAPQQQCP